MSTGVLTRTAVLPQPGGHEGEPGTSTAVTYRAGLAADAPVLHALIAAHAAEGHLLPRDLADLTAHAARFVVALRDGRIVGCAELAPLGGSVAEIRSLVVDRSARALGIGSALVAELRQRARIDGFERLCAFTHDARYFVRLGFSIVPHVWVPEKIALDCQRCPQFRRCGQHAVVLAIPGRPVSGLVPLASLRG